MTSLGMMKFTLESDVSVYLCMSPPEWIFQAVWIKIANIHYFNHCKILMVLFVIRAYILLFILYTLGYVKAIQHTFTVKHGTDTKLLHFFQRN